MPFVKVRFVAVLFFSSLSAVLAGGVGSLFFLPWVYSAEVLDGEAVVVIRAPQGGIVRSLRVEKGERVRADTIVAEVVATDIQPPDALVARSILYKRVENARFESQRGGLKEILLKPDLRERLGVDRDYARFVGEQRRLFRSFQNKLEKAAKSLRKERNRLEVQVRGMEGEIAALTERQLLLEQKLATEDGAELRSEVQRNRRSSRRHRKQLRGLQRKVRSNAKALLETTLRVRREESVGMEGIRAELNALYARMGLPKNAFDRLGFTDGGGQRLRRLIARRAGRVVRVAEGVYPGDVVVRGQVLAEILPDGVRSKYRLRLEDAGGVLAGLTEGSGGGTRSLRCEDFPGLLSWQPYSDRSAGERGEGSLLLERAVLQEVDFPSLREGGRCSVVVGLGGRLGDRADIVWGVARKVFEGSADWRGLREGVGRIGELAGVVGGELWVRVDSLRNKKMRAVAKNFVDDIKKTKINN